MTVKKLLSLVVMSAAVHAGCAPKSAGTAPVGTPDPATGVVRPEDGSVPFYPMDLELRSVPSMPRAPKRDPNRPMALWHEELIGRPGAHLFARNDGAVPLRITKVSVTQCINIYKGCMEWDPNLVLQPGEKKWLYSVVPQAKGKSWRYQWNASGGPERRASPPPSASTQQQGTQAGNSRMVIPPPPGNSGDGPTGSDGRVLGGVNGAGGAGIISDATGNPLDSVGATVVISSTAGGERSVTSTLPAERFRARRMRLLGDVDARNVRGGVTLWLKVEGPSGTQTMESGPATSGTGTKVTPLSVTVAIPANATKVTLGVKLTGTGDVIVKKFKFREVVK